MAIGFVVQTELPQSNEVTPAMQLTVISYCMLGLISLASIAVFFLVSIEKRRAKRELRLGAKRSFQQRWKSLGAGQAGAESGAEPAGLSSTAGLSASAAELGAAKAAQEPQPTSREAAFAAAQPSEHFAGGAQRAARAPRASPHTPCPQGLAGRRPLRPLQGWPRTISKTAPGAATAGGPTCGGGGSTSRPCLRHGPRLAWLRRPPRGRPAGARAQAGCGASG